MDDLEALLSVTTLVGRDPADALDFLAHLFDEAHDLGREDGLVKGIQLADELLKTRLADDQEALLHYYLGNAWASLRSLRRHGDEAAWWAWEQSEAREEVLSYRRSVAHRGFPRLAVLRQCQVSTNLGNLMSSVGRFVEAMRYYDSALHLDLSFGMALAGKGDCILHYARALYDDGHQAIFARACVDLIDGALKLPLEPGVEPRLRAAKHYALQRAGSGIDDWNKEFGEGLGRSADEVAYRTWALENRLFVNPLNDLGPYAVASRDVLLLPTMQVDASIGSGFHGFFNQIKQEFIAARYVCFEGLHDTRLHHADERTLLVDTWNQTALGIAIEKIKFAFRSAYSVLDKISIFVARYFRLPAQLHQVNIRSVWYVGKAADASLRPEFTGRQNWPLRGLFWLAKDLHEWDIEYHTALEPDARETAKLRNQLEHQYARVVDQQLARDSPAPVPVPPDPFAYVVSRAELEAKALRMLQTTRAALIYLSLALHAEEKGCEDTPGPGVYRGAFPILSQ